MTLLLAFLCLCFFFFSGVRLFVILSGETALSSWDKGKLGTAQLRLIMQLV